MKQFALAVLAVGALAGVVRGNGAGSDAAGYEILANANGFGVDIPGCPDASKNIREIQIDDLHIDARETTTGPDAEYRVYRPGAVHWGNATFTSAVALGGGKQLQAWFNDAAHGKNIRKNITVTLFKKDRSPGRAYTLVDAYPIAWKSNENDLSGQEPAESLTVGVDHIVFWTRGADGSVGKPRNGFHVDISGVAPPEPDDVDNAWDTANGAAESRERHPLVLGLNVDPTLETRGKSTFTDLVLTGPMTDGRRALVDWLNNPVALRKIAVGIGPQERRGQPDYDCSDIFPIHYPFPHMNVRNNTGMVHEEVRLRPTRCEIK